MAAFIPTALRVYRFQPKGLDPIVVYVEEYRPQSSRITIQCYAQAWTSYWGAHGEKGLEHFFVSCNTDYLIDNLTWGNNGMMLKRVEKLQRAYLARIVTAIQDEFRKNK